MKPITLSELTEALELDCDELVTFVDVEEGCLVSVDKALLRAIEEGHEIDPGDLPEWETDQFDVAKQIVKHFGKRFIKAPSKNELPEIKLMESFIGTVTHADAAGQLSRAIRGKGAFRNFKDTAYRLKLLDSWYSHREEAVRKLSIAWAEENKIPYVDDSV